MAQVKLRLRLGHDLGLNVSLSSAGHSLGAARDWLGRKTAHIQRLSHGHYRSMTVTFLWALHIEKMRPKNM